MLPFDRPLNGSHSSRRRAAASSSPSESILVTRLDTSVATETPEGIFLELRPAGLSVRYYAFILDWAIRLAVLFAAAMIAAVAGGIGTAFWLILALALEWLYPMVFELTPAGATP